MFVAILKSQNFRYLHLVKIWKISYCIFSVSYCLLIIKCRLFLIFKRRFRAITEDNSKGSNTEGQEIKPLKFVTSYEPQIL